MSMHFPQYRKIQNKLIFYKIIDEQSFIEYSKIGENLQCFEFSAKNFFDHQLILNLKEEKYPYQKIDKNEFDDFVSKKKEP